MASVLITGAGKGIGLETALAFARTGYTVHATMRNSAQAAEIEQTASVKKLPIKAWIMDVDSDESVRDTISAIQQSGPVDVLVNNAGVERSSSTEELPLSEFRAVMETNYFGAIRCIQALVRQMRERRSGCIINVSSIAGRITNPPFSAYCASKWALEGLSEALAAEMKIFGVRVAIIEPGIIDTAMARRVRDNVDPSLYPQKARMAPLFINALSQSAPPSLVADKIVEVAQSGTWQVRHPVGPDAMSFLRWRDAFTDEEWVALYASDDETWQRQLEKDFGVSHDSSRKD